MKEDSKTAIVVGVLSCAITVAIGLIVVLWPK
jgi:hypothetical protein